MKPIKSTLALLLLLAGAGFAPVAFADLFARPHGMVYDSGQNLTWLQDANYASTQFTQSGGTQGADGGAMDWATANGWANNLVFTM